MSLAAVQRTLKSAGPCCVLGRRERGLEAPGTKGLGRELGTAVVGGASAGSWLADARLCRPS